MDESSLPADLESWPRDPFELLGLKLGADLKTVKRAYQRLIRVYRPEHHPVEFRRIREAYESAQSLTGWFSSLDAEVAEELLNRASEAEPNATDESPPKPTPATTDLEPPVVESAIVESATVEPRPVPLADHLQPLLLDDASAVPEGAAEGFDDLPLDDAELDDLELVGPDAADEHGRDEPDVDDFDVDDFDVDDYGERPYEKCLIAAWSPALRGDSVAAYRKLSKLRRARPGRAEAYLALYWLLRLSPKLELERRPCDWLAECLTSVAERGPALELYRREIVRRPAEALTPRCAALVRSSLGREETVALVEWRWRAAMGLPRDGEAIVREDLDALRKTSISFDSSAWLRILWNAVETCCWSRMPPAQELAATCLRELESIANLPDTSHDALSQLDYMIEAAAAVGLVGATDSAVMFRRLISRSWSLVPQDLYVLLGRFVEPFLSRPADLLRFLSDVGARAPMLLGRYGQVVQIIGRQLERDPETFWTPPTAEPVIVEFLADNQVQVRYDDELRAVLLLFCLYERMPPDLIAETIHGSKKFSQLHHWLPGQIAQDWPLLFSYRTIRLMTA